MPAYEFDTVIENEGVILLSNEESLQDGKKHFSAMKLKTKGFKFDRKAANER